MTRSGSISAALILVLFAAVGGASERVRIEKGRLWIECRNASLPDMLREIAVVVPMEMWLDEGVEDERVSLSLSGVTMKEAVEKLFEDTKVNYMLYLDPADAETVAKIYVGSGGGGRLGREPTLSDTRPLEPEDELDPEQFLESPEAQETLSALKSFLEQQKAVETSESAESSEGVQPELDELLNNIPDLPTRPLTPGLPPEQSEPPDRAGPEPNAKEKEKLPQL